VLDGGIGGGGNVIIDVVVLNVSIDLTSSDLTRIRTEGAHTGINLSRE